MLTAVPSHLRRAARRLAAAVHRRLASWTEPAPRAVAAGLAADAVRSRHALALENAPLRQQVVILRRHAKRPRFTARDRGLIGLLAGRFRTWTQALVIVKPATVLRWQRQGFRLLWRRKSTPGAIRARIPAETVALIRRRAAENRRWGADRIRGQHPAWYINLAKHPEQVWIAVDGRKVQVRPESLKGAERAEAWRRIVAQAPGSAGYATKTDREMPVVRLRAAA